MGQCQSVQRSAQRGDPLIGTSVDVAKEEMISPLQKTKLKRRTKLELITYRNNDEHNPSLLSPMSANTQPETPSPKAAAAAAAATTLSPGTPSTPKTLVSMITALASTTSTPGKSNKYYTPRVTKIRAPITPIPETPCASNNYNMNQIDEDGNDDDDHNSIERRLQLTASSTPSSLLMIVGLDNTVMIPEEVDPDAPSDEEDSYQRYVETSHEENGVSAWEMEPGPIISASPSSNRKNAANQKQLSPPRPQSSIKRRHKHVTRASSIQRHPVSPLVAPAAGATVVTMAKTPRGSVDRQTLAEFNKLKVQVQLQQHEQKIERRQKKFEDRYEDVAKSRQLYRDFEATQDAVSVHSTQSKQSRTSRQRTDSFDLKDPESWYYDFGSVVASDDDDDSLDNTSQFSYQSQYSLLSSASMESQRRFYAAKRNKTSTKIDQLEATLARLNAEKRVSDADELDSSRRRGDYGPPSICSETPSRGSAVVRRLSVSSDYGPTPKFARRLSNDVSLSSCTSRTDYGPPSRSNSLRSLPVDYGQLRINDDVRSAAKMRQQAIEESMPKRPATPPRKEYDSNDLEARIDTPQRSGTNSLEASRHTTDKEKMETRSSSLEASRHDDKDDTPQRSGTSTEPSSSSTSAERILVNHIVANAPSSHERKSSWMPIRKENESPADEMKHDQEVKEAEFPRWRSFLHDSPSSALRKTSPPSTTTKKANAVSGGAPIWAMSKEEFLHMSDDHALIRIAKVPTDDDDDDGVVRARRLNFFGGGGTSDDDDHHEGLDDAFDNSTIMPSDDECDDGIRMLDME